MGSSVDGVGSSTRAPILEVWRHDEEDVNTIPIPLICNSSCPWRKGPAAAAGSQDEGVDVDQSEEV